MSNALTGAANPPAPATFREGDACRLRVAPHVKQRPLIGLPAEVRAVREERVGGRFLAFVTLWVDDGSETGQVVRDVPMGFLSPPAEKLKRRSPLTLKPPADDRTERQKQDEGQEWLTRRGYTVLVVGQYMKKVRCEGCGNWFWPEGFGNSVGTPDLLVTCPSRWPVRTWTVLEYKKDEKAPRGQKQVELVEAGSSVFVWSLPMLKAALLEVETALGIEPHPDLLPKAESVGVAA